MDQVSDLNKITTILMVSGIANPSTFEEYLKPLCSDIVKLEFNDHQEYTEEKLEKIRDSFLALPTRKKVIVTTEKDCMRFRNQEAESKLSEFPFYYVPIKFEFHPQDKEIFDAAIRAILRQKSG
jgi:tetraacyldisaccharide 4'-kinase